MNRNALPLQLVFYSLTHLDYKLFYLKYTRSEFKGEVTESFFHKHHFTVLYIIKEHNKTCLAFLLSSGEDKCKNYSHHTETLFGIHVIVLGWHKKSVKLWSSGVFLVFGCTISNKIGLPIQISL